MSSMEKITKLSVKEIEILRFIHEFGFCEIGHVMRRFDLKKTGAYLHMQGLMQYGLVMNARIIKYQPRAYLLTARGVDFLKLDLPLVRRIPLHIYEHQLAVINVCLALQKSCPNAVWRTERRLNQEKYLSGSEKNDHLPDGVLVFPQGHSCAVEVERSLKARKRLEQILLGYCLQDKYREVWYFCSRDVLSVINEFARDMPYIKTFNLSEYLP